MEIMTMGSVWYPDNGASFHMTRNKEFFSDLEEKDIHMHIEIWDDVRYSAASIGTVTFQRESHSHLRHKNVMCVPGLKKNQVSIVVFEDHGYDVIFNKGNKSLRHISMGKVKKFKIRVNNLYKLDVEDYAALSTKPNMVQSQDISEVWHSILGYLRYGALKIMQIFYRPTQRSTRETRYMQRLYIW